MLSKCLYRRMPDGTLRRIDKDVSMVGMPTMEMSQNFARTVLQANPDADVVRLLSNETVVFEWPDPNYKRA